ncbi:MAG: CBS domain-containing protein [Deltaproteobacteria bacterium]|nr:CBS domain-containing protein [Deltaproteobacteria bacterium]
MTTIADIMTKDVITVTEETPLRELARILSEKHINGVPVVDDKGTVLGVVCESDLVGQNRPLHIPTVFVIFDSFIPLESPWRLKEEFKRITATKVGDIYSSPAVTLSPKDDIAEAARLMQDKRYYTIPVLEGGKLVGIVGKADLIRTLL